MKTKKQPPLLQSWRVARIVREEFWVCADTKEEAGNRASDPHSVTVIKETIRKAKHTP
jgi:hypothetical protein